VFGGGASVDGGRVYVTTGLGEVAALEAATGKQIWKVKPAGPLRGSPTVAFGTVFVMTQNNEIHALNADDGTELWQEAASLGQTGVFGVGAPAAGQGSVVAGFSTASWWPIAMRTGANCGPTPCRAPRSRPAWAC
jgi:outer membrane protein assembly factor BamB